MIADGKTVAVRHSRLQEGRRGCGRHKLRGCKERMARLHLLVESWLQQVEEELELQTSLQAKEHIQGQEYSVLQMLIEAVVPDLPWRAGSPHNDAQLRHQMLLQAVKCRPVC